MNIGVENKKVRMFFEENIWQKERYFSQIHKHNYAEIHIVEEGTAEFIVDNVKYTVSGCGAIFIPWGKYHSVKTKSEALKFTAFQVDSACDKISRKKFPKGFLNEEFNREFINRIIFIYNELVSESIIVQELEKDYGYEIDKFFALKYNQNIHISDLANELNLSVMQTQRVIKKHTGKTFGENLLIHRMLASDNLMKYTDMTMLDISEYVGYGSYSGFWKAYRKYKGIKENY